VRVGCMMKACGEESGPLVLERTLRLSSSGKWEDKDSSNVIRPRSTHWRAAIWVMNLPADAISKVFSWETGGASGARD